MTFFLLPPSLSQNYRQARDGWTALHAAACNGHARCLKKLLARGADLHLTVNLTETDRERALVFAYALQDSRGRKACDVAVLHGQFECARLLRSLHWARRKDDQLESSLAEAADQRRRQYDRALVESRLKREAADRAYEEWTQQKPGRVINPPSFCRERLESKSQSPHSCSTCTTSSRRSSGRQSSLGKSTATIKLNMSQAKRNIECTGRPAKLHPYSNHPPQCKHKRKTPARGSQRSRCESRANKSSPASPATIKITCDDRGHLQKGDEIEKSQHDSEEEGSQDRVTDSGQDNECVSERTSSELNISFMNTAAAHLPGTGELGESGDHVEVQFLVGGVEEDEEAENLAEEEDNDDLAFHDVGGANSFNSLSLPGALTRNRTVTEMMQLLRHLGNSGSRSLTSCYGRRHSFSCGLQRRFSLGAIPEGQMVTNYSSDSVPSLGEHSSWLRLAEPGSSSQHLQQRDGEKEEERKKIESERVTIEHQMKQASKEDTAVKVSCEGERIPVTGTQKERKTLKIVNLMWNTESSSVQSSITESPMTPLNHSWQHMSATHSSNSRPSSPHTTPPPTSSPRHSTPRHSSPSSSSSQVTTPTLSNDKQSLYNTNVALSVEPDCPAVNSPTSSEGDEDENERESNYNLMSPECQPSTLHSLSQQPFVQPAHSLFGHAMSGLASKSMISLATGHIPLQNNSPNHSGFSHLPQWRRRAKSAPDVLDLQPDNTAVSEGSPIF